MIGSTNDGKAYPFEGKYPPKYNDYPGPGHYDPFDEDNIPVPKTTYSPERNLTTFAQ